MQSQQFTNISSKSRGIDLQSFLMILCIFVFFKLFKWKLHVFQFSLEIKYTVDERVIQAGRIDKNFHKIII